MSRVFQPWPAPRRASYSCGVTETSPAAANPMRIFALANQKGGVGKTTTAINLATALAALGHRVLLVDLDPQGNASTGLGMAAEARGPGSYAVLIGSVPLRDAVVPTSVPLLSLVPATVDLLGAEIELVDLPRREFRLADAFADVRRHGDFDFVFIDCPPALGFLTLNALTAADSILVPLQCEFFALEGLSHLMRTVDLVRQRFNPHLAIDGVVLTMYDRRNSLSDQVAADVRSHFGERVFETTIPRNVRIAEAPSHGKPILLYDLRCPGSLAYVALAAELIRRLMPQPGLAA
ncbi:MAG: ParA family protein [Alphaproteobacteria bacterium]|nr:ParA family protein [Alphaproteobacteria bacterium]